MIGIFRLSLINRGTTTASNRYPGFPPLRPFPARVYELPKAEVSCQEDVCYVNVNTDVGLENHIQQIVKEKAYDFKFFRRT
jgi:hypothetical protein